VASLPASLNVLLAQSKNIGVSDFSGENFLSERSVKDPGLVLEGAFDLCPQLRSRSLPGSPPFLEFGNLLGLSCLSSLELLGNSFGQC
jgi:hypothetical protein